MTNNTKAQVIAAVNAALIMVISFGLAITDAQQAAIMGGVNAILSLFMVFTYKNSHKRIPDKV